MESWAPGPYTLFPESKPGTYTNLVRDVIRRIRGIDDEGKPFAADLSLLRRNGAAFRRDPEDGTRAAGGQIVTFPLHDRPAPLTFQIVIRNDGTEVNRGDCRATMLLRVTQSEIQNWAVAYRSASGTDITRQILADGEADGYFVGGLEPGQSKPITVTLTPRNRSVLADHAVLNFQLYWNPQDPRALVRDAMTVRIDNRPAF